MEMFEPAPLTWDARRAELRLQSLPIDIGATPGETPFTLEARRAAAADRHGNIYWIDGDRHRLRVWSVGSDRESAFWPDGPVDCTAAHRPTRSDFEPSLTIAPVDRVFTALAVTEDHYLVVAFTSPSAKGLLAFDLMAGGLPVETLWPAAVAFSPFDMARRCGGGVWVLDRVNSWLWELDRHLAAVSRGQTPTTLAAVEVDVFQPLTGTPRERPAAVFPAGIDLNAFPASPVDPISVQAAEDGSALILDRNEGDGRSRVFRLRREGDAIMADALPGSTSKRTTSSWPRSRFVAPATPRCNYLWRLLRATRHWRLPSALGHKRFRCAGRSSSFPCGALGAVHCWRFAAPRTTTAGWPSYAGCRSCNSRARVTAKAPSSSRGFSMGVNCSVFGIG